MNIDVTAVTGQSCPDRRAGIDDLARLVGELADRALESGSWYSVQTSTFARIRARVTNGNEPLGTLSRSGSTARCYPRE